MPVVVVDTCVLFPPSLRDLLLTLAALGAYSVRWSEEILAELHRTVTERYPDIDPKQFDNATIGAMRNAFPDAVVTGWEELVDQMDNDPVDRHVAAAAVAAGADTIVTLNVGDFAGRVLSDRHLRSKTPSTSTTRRRLNTSLRSSTASRTACVVSPDGGRHGTPTPPCGGGPSVRTRARRLSSNHEVAQDPAVARARLHVGG